MSSEEGDLRLMVEGLDTCETEGWLPRLPRLPEEAKKRRLFEMVLGLGRNPIS